MRLKTRHMTPSMRVGLLELMLTISVMLSPAFAQPEAPSSVVTNYKPITERERLEWFLVSTTGPSSLFGAGPLSAGLSTAFNNPEEYGPHWEGFGKRYGMRLMGVSTENAIEANTRHRVGRRSPLLPVTEPCLRRACEIHHQNHIPSSKA